MNSDQIKLQAKKAYERGRLKAAVKFLWFVVPIVVISAGTCGELGFPLAIGTLLSVSVVALKWRGEEYGFSVGPGLLSGTVAFSIPLVLHIFGVCCRSNLEILLCTLSGLLAGVVIGLQINKTKRPHKLRALGLAVGVATLTAALGCLSLGVGATLGLLGAMTVSAFSLFALRAQS